MLDTIYHFFWVQGYIVELLLAIVLFTYWMPWRRNIRVRFLLVIVGAFIISYLWSLIPLKNYWMNSVKTLFFFCYSILGAFFCYEVSIHQIVFYITAASGIQHLSYKSAMTLLIFVLHKPLDKSIFWGIGYPILFLVALFGYFFIFGRRLRKEEFREAGIKFYIPLLFMGLQLCTNLFQNIYDAYAYMYNHEIMITFYLCNTATCLLLICIQCNIINLQNEHITNQILNQLLYQQKQQMELSKDTIELIHIKCHDLKKQINSIQNRLTPEEIEGMNTIVGIYDSAVRTGNEVLDIIIFEKSVICQKKGISLNCMAHTVPLNQMKTSDIYALFGNILDNAIEALTQVEHEEHKSIQLRIRQEKGMLMIHCENFYKGKLTFKNDLPVTIKKDKRYHGYGMKSIRKIVKDYDGYLSIKTADQIFAVNILIPIQSA